MQTWLNELRNEFEFLSCGVRPVAYLDNAATTQRPRSVVERMSRFYNYENANVHRGVYKLSQHSTIEYENSRQKVHDFLQAGPEFQTIFTRGVTESINLLAHSLPSVLKLEKGDEILLSVCEHHSNLVPWQMLAERSGAKIKAISLNSKNEIDLAEFHKLCNSRTKIFAIQHVSNVLGVVHPIEDMIKTAKSHGAIVVVDGAQAVPHFQVNVAKLGCDFYTFSGHKMFGPFGIGVLIGRKNLLNAMQPFHGGGDMIETVTIDTFTTAELPNKFEAGTPNIAGAIGLGAAVDFIKKFSSQKSHQHEIEIAGFLYDALIKNPRITVFSKRPGLGSVGVVSFYHKDIHPHDLAAFADQDGVCIRAGHHCAQPLMKFLGVSSSSRVSPYWYNTMDDIERFLRSMHKAERKLAV